MIIGRDAASCGFSSIVLERDAAIGGVWLVNDYPGLGLQNAGSFYRCLSLAPSWQVQGEGHENMRYAPRAKEIITYIAEMADHELVDIRLKTAWRSQQWDGRGFVVGTSQELLSARAVVFATGVHEVNAGLPYWPISRSLITNGACVLHSSELNSGKAAFLHCKHQVCGGCLKSSHRRLGVDGP